MAGSTPSARGRGGGRRRPRLHGRWRVVWATAGTAGPSRPCPPVRRRRSGRRRPGGAPPSAEGTSWPWLPPFPTPPAAHVLTAVPFRVAFSRPKAAPYRAYDRDGRA